MFCRNLVAAARTSFTFRNFSTLRYAKSHEWFKQVEGNVYAIGISNHARENLGEVIYASTPEVGETVTIGEGFMELESIKAVASVYSPITGKIVAVNDLGAEYASLNSAPQTDGWLIKVEAAEFSDDVLTAEKYNAEYPDNE